MEDRSWANEMTQEEFFHEYQRRNPFADVIPHVREYVNGSEPVYHGIGPINPEDYETDTVAPKQEVEKKDVLYCKGCGKEFNHPKGNKMAKAAHEKHCKALLAART